MKQCIVWMTSIGLFMSLSIAAGCRKTAPGKTDNALSPRIITFSPSLTDIVFDMGLGDHVVGVAAHSDVPADRELPIVGNDIAVNTEAILIARPDVLLAELDPAMFARISEGEPNIIVEHFAIKNVGDIALAAQRIGKITGHADAGNKSAAAFQADLKAIQRLVEDKPHPRVIFVRDFRQPYVAGRNTLLHEMIQIAGGVNAAADRWEGWAAVNPEHIFAVRPDVLICQAAPDEVEQARQYWADMKGLPASRKGRVFVVSDSTWLGNSLRLSKRTRQLADMIHAGANAVAPESAPASRGAGG